MKKKQARLRRVQKTRARIRLQGANRLCVFRTPRHIYAQIIAPNGSEVITSASTLDKDVKKKVKYTGNIEAASIVGEILAKRAKKAGITKVAFDRSGFKFHGRVKALAESVRENGMEF
ncbi:MAG: 50S ribosomal protein L18 [Gammaproteobacteria bacterium]|nr:50S ribosomal protein L18 [Gammaproteobacteria bacterium]